MRVPLSATREGWHCHSLRLEPRRHVLQARDVVERWTCDCASLRLVASTLANRNRDTVTGRHKHPSPIEVTGADARQFSVQTFMVFMPVSASVCRKFPIMVWR